MKRASMIAILDIGATIKKLRKLKGLSQDELAKDICDRTTITKLENGFSKIPSFIFVLQICDKLDISVDEFINFALSSSYTLNKKEIFNSLINNDIEKISEYLSKIDIEALSLKDKQLYNYLIAKIYINNGKMDKAKEYLLMSLNDNKSFKTDNIMNLLAYYELLKNELIVPQTKSLNKILIESTIKANNKDMGYFYLIDNLIKDGIKNNELEYINILLEKQLNLINDEGYYKYLSIYYQNKLKLNLDNENIKRDLESKIKAINKINKISH